jgi:threonine/homoserine efflux transporter RhtA
MRTTHTSLYAYVNPVVAVFLGWLILSEPLTWVSVLAMIVILGGVALVQTSGGRRAAQPAVADGGRRRQAPLSHPWRRLASPHS